ncbi:hypothetical protein BU26DRAFT_575681 [Trematosphaeria pertusa]|uniref:Zinc finger PHD-type domain-containing protein n=1 Tax=Trematosphaeria pertusa TaxID=390896 RepID=A0A6A6J474_9PLEO|nr:uncharacterized protein BU26DRAFT_575681 [Trematosphaeria pertusa]KAF2257157.1 hypothetical protein BU26DRAFT_575681 [Trematosphaeria pertusa]
MSAQPTTPAAENVKYGVYWYQDLADLTGKDALLIGTFDTEREVYTFTTQHAANEIGKHPEWGSSHEIERPGLLEIVGADKSVKLRYDYCKVIDDGAGSYQRELPRVVVSPSEQDEDSTTVGSEKSTEGGSEGERSMTEPSDEAPATPKSSGIRYALYVSRNLDDPAAKVTKLLNMDTSIGEARSNMQVIAGGEIATRNKEGTKVHCRLEQKRLQIFEVMSGQPVLEYTIHEGRVLGDRFIREEDWQNGVREGDKMAFPRMLTPPPEELKEEEATSNQRRSSRKRKAAADEDSEDDEDGEDGEAVTMDDPDGSANDDVVEQEVFCRCKQPWAGVGTMVECANRSKKKCPNNRWVHLGCVGLKNVPTQKNWRCPECRPNKRRRKSGR